MKVVHAKYDSSPNINSFALQCSAIHNGGSGPLHAPDDNIVFIYPTVKFQLKVVRHLVITVTQSVGDETYKFIRTRIKHHCL